MDGIGDIDKMVELQDMEEVAVESVEYSHEVPNAPEEQEDFSQAADMINPPRIKRERTTIANSEKEMLIKIISEADGGKFNDIINFPNEHTTTDLKEAWVRVTTLFNLNTGSSMSREQVRKAFSRLRQKIKTDGTDGTETSPRIPRPKRSRRTKVNKGQRNLAAQITNKRSRVLNAAAEVEYYDKLYKREKEYKLAKMRNLEYKCRLLETELVARGLQMPEMPPENRLSEEENRFYLDVQ